MTAPALVSPHLPLRDAIRSQTAERLGLPNTPTAAILEAMRQVAAACYEPAVAALGPIGVSSFYRAPAVNAAIGGSRTSDHCRGRAIDLDAIPATDLTNAALFEWLRAHVPFDQLIWEFGDDDQPAWVHVSYRGPTNRRQVLRAARLAGRVVYQPFPAAPTSHAGGSS